MASLKQWSKLGFGAARCMAGVTENEQALTKALQEGFNVVDTCATYMGGDSEKMVGKVIKNDVSAAIQDTVTLVSKFGYAAQDKNVPGAVPLVDVRMSHSIHPDFMRAELKASTERLRARPDIYLLHNPEHQYEALLSKYFEGKASSSSSSDSASSTADAIPTEAVEEARASFLESIENTFTALEERVSAGAVGSYGISCRSLILPPANPMYLPWERVVEAASSAAKKAGNVRSSFSTVQFPVNLLEPEGLKLAPAMAAAGLRVMSNRPLTALGKEGTMRLVDKALVSPPTDYMDVCRATLEHFTFPPPSEQRDATPEEVETMEGCQFIHHLIQDMNRELPKFTCFMHYEEELARSIIPLLNERLDGMDGDSVMHMFKFFKAYGDMIRYSCAQRARSAVVDDGSCPSGKHDLAEDQRLHLYALNWLQQQESISCTVIGMPRVTYVADALQLLKK